MYSFVLAAIMYIMVGCTLSHLTLTLTLSLLYFFTTFLLFTGGGRAATP